MPQTQLLTDINALVVDDDPEIRALLERILNAQGAICALASNAAEAAPLLKGAHPFEVVITDLHMPGGSGLDVVRAATDATGDIAVLVLTGENDQDIATRLIDLGVYGYMTKPPRPADLVIAVRSALERRATRIKNRLAREASEHDLQKQTVLHLIAAAELRDDETGDHIVRMSDYVAVVARAYGLPEDRVEMLRLASPMHDLGKIGVPDSVLRKPGPLTLEERQTMQLHAEIGHQILANSDSALLRLSALLALTHHERYDGTGYPRGLVAEEIPIEGRIAAVADVFDALTSDRCYRPAMSVEVALELMRGERGYHFDPDVFDAFLGSLEEILRIKDAQELTPLQRAA